METGLNRHYRLTDELSEAQSCFYRFPAVSKGVAGKNLILHPGLQRPLDRAAGLRPILERAKVEDIRIAHVLEHFAAEG